MTLGVYLKLSHCVVCPLHTGEVYTDAPKGSYRGLNGVFGVANGNA